MARITRAQLATITPLRWAGIVACMAGIAATLVWSWDAWARALAHWRLTLLVAGGLALFLGSKVAQARAALTRARVRVKQALEDAPTALRVEELASACKDCSLELVERALREGMEQGWVRVLGVGEGRLRYAFEPPSALTVVSEEA